MKKNINLLKPLLNYQSQMILFERLSNELETEDVEQLDIFYRLIYSIFVDHYGSPLENLDTVLKNISISDFNNKDSLQWGLMRNIFFLKILFEKNIEYLNIIKKDINNNKTLEDKRIKKVLSGVNIPLIEKKIQTINKKDINQNYAWDIELLKNLLEYNIYEFIDNVENFKINKKAESLILKIKGDFSQTYSLEG